MRHLWCRTPRDALHEGRGSARLQSHQQPLGLHGTSILQGWTWLWVVVRRLKDDQSGNWKEHQRRP